MALTKKEYTTLALVKSELNISGAAQDTYLEGLITRASRAIDNFCNREFWHESSRTFRFYIKHSPRLVLPVRPLISITSVTDLENSTTLDSTRYEIENGDAGIVYFDPPMPRDVGYHYASIQSLPVPHSIKKRYQIDYEAGYETAEQSGTGADTLPEDISYACERLVVEYYRNRGTPFSMQREHLLEAAVWYNRMLMGEDAYSLLKAYQRRVIL